jgi:hypothetical protein
LNYGLRYDIFTPQTEAYDRQTNFDYIAGKLVRRGDGGSYPGLRTHALISTDWNNFAPRFGFAYKATPRTVIRSSYGIFFVTESQAGQQMTLNPPFVGGTNFTNTAVPQQINRTLNQGLPRSDPLIPINDPSGSINSRHPENRTGYSQQWSFQDSTTACVELSFGSRVCRQSVASHPGSVQSESTLSSEPVRWRGDGPYFESVPRVTGFTHVEQRGVGNYHALQIGINKRFANGLSFLTNYTWSKAIENPASNYGNTGHQDVRNLDADRALAGVDLRHRWVGQLALRTPLWPGTPVYGQRFGFRQSIGWRVAIGRCRAHHERAALHGHWRGRSA